MGRNQDMYRGDVLGVLILCFGNNLESACLHGSTGQAWIDLT